MALDDLITFQRPRRQRHQGAVAGGRGEHQFRRAITPGVHPGRLYRRTASPCPTIPPCSCAALLYALDRVGDEAVEERPA